MSFLRLLPAFSREIRTLGSHWATGHRDALRVGAEYAQATANQELCPPIDDNKVKYLAAMTHERLFQPHRSLHELGCGMGENLLAIQSSFPHLELYGSDFNPEQIMRLRGLAQFQKIALDVIDCEEDLAALRPVDAILLRGVEFALSDKALRQLALTCQARGLSQEIYIVSNHVAGLRTAVATAKDAVVGAANGRLIGWYRSVRLLSQLMHPYELTRIVPNYGGSVCCLLHFEVRNANRLAT